MVDELLAVYLETGSARTFAAAVDWPGWCRSGRDEISALRAFVECGRRYDRVLAGSGLEFRAPASLSGLAVVERLAGNATTDFGAPGQPLPADARPVTAGELQRWQTILAACWRAFDRAVQAAQGKTLRKGPRGGGRELIKMVEHVRDVDIAYMASLGGKKEPGFEKMPLQDALDAIRRDILATLNRAAGGELPANGPRGGTRWPPRYFVRRLAWHELDHAWEIEDRVE